jgi:hypothetical protein
MEKKTENFTMFDSATRPNGTNNSASDIVFFQTHLPEKIYNMLNKNDYFLKFKRAYTHYVAFTDNPGVACLIYDYVSLKKIKNGSDDFVSLTYWDSGRVDAKTFEQFKWEFLFQNKMILERSGRKYYSDDDSTYFNLNYGKETDVEKRKDETSKCVDKIMNLFDEILSHSHSEQDEKEAISFFDDHENDRTYATSKLY